MNRLAFPAAALALAIAAPALAQPMPPPGARPGPMMAPDHTLLTVSAEGKSTRAPDLAVFGAGVTSQADTASAALAQNAAAMNGVVAALKRAGTAPRDIQTSNLGLEPIYAPPRRLPDGSFEDQGQRIVGYRASNTVTVRQRKLDDYGKVIDALVAAGANQVNGPSFTLDQPDAAMDEARVAAIKAAQARAALYARAAGLKVVRIVAIDENGGDGVRPMVMQRMMVAKTPMAAPSPVEAGELDISANITVKFELAPAS